MSGIAKFGEFPAWTGVWGDFGCAAVGFSRLKNDLSIKSFCSQTHGVVNREKSATKRHLCLLTSKMIIGLPKKQSLYNMVPLLCGSDPIKKMHQRHQISLEEIRFVQQKHLHQQKHMKDSLQLKKNATNDTWWFLKFMWPESSWTRTEPNLLRSWSFEFPFPRHFSLGTNSGVGLSPTGHLFLTQICHLKSPSPKIPCWLVGGFFTNPIWNICSHQIGLWFPQGSDWT